MSEAPMEVAPLRGLRFDLERLAQQGGGTAPLVTSPPYDVISEEDHQALLDASSHNIVRLTLGDVPGQEGQYEQRAELLAEWVEKGALKPEDEACFYVYEIEYSVPGSDERRRMLGFIGLGRLHPFDDRIVLRHEETFAKVVEDRQKLLAATRANLESIFLLYSDVDGEIDALLERGAEGEPVVCVEAKPGETHALYPIRERETADELAGRMRAQRPLIADGHHRYTTSLRYQEANAAAGETVAGDGWQLMTFTNLHSPGLSILATHRMLSLREGADVAEVLSCLDEKLERVTDGSECELAVQTADEIRQYRIPESERAALSGVQATDYGFLHQKIVAEWLSPWTDAEPRIRYYKEGTGEDEALRRGDGDLLFRMRPVGREEFQSVIEGGDVYPHKTTYFYPKLWSGLVVWQLEEPLASRVE